LKMQARITLVFFFVVLLLLVSILFFNTFTLAGGTPYWTDIFVLLVAFALAYIVFRILGEKR
jgi:hypothetical protein